ncbi:MAG: hypothetical protein WC708_19465 [Lentisphaeria bacterium]
MRDVFIRESPLVLWFRAPGAEQLETGANAGGLTERSRPNRGTSGYYLILLKQNKQTIPPRNRSEGGMDLPGPKRM